MAKLRMAHASTHDARKPPGPKSSNVTRYPCNHRLWTGHRRAADLTADYARNASNRVGEYCDTKPGHVSTGQG